NRRMCLPLPATTARLACHLSLARKSRVATPRFFVSCRKIATCVPPCHTHELVRRSAGNIRCIAPASFTHTHPKGMGNGSCQLPEARLGGAFSQEWGLSWEERRNILM